MAQGDCYEVHAKHLMEIFIKNKDDPKLKDCHLCHGDVIGAKNSPVAGKQFGHCWIEINNDILLDLSNDKQIIASYRQLKDRIVWDTIKRYKPEEVAKLLLKHEHYGPWDD